MIRKEFTGMLPAAIEKFEELLEAAKELNPSVARGYDSVAGPGSFYYWGVACRVQSDNQDALKEMAEEIGIIWLSNDGDMAFTKGLEIGDFQTFRVNGNLDMSPESEEDI